MNSVEFIQEFAKYGRALFYIVHRTRNYFHPEYSEYFTYCYRIANKILSRSHPCFRAPNSVIIFELSHLNNFVKFKIFTDYDDHIEYHLFGYYKEDVAVETIWRYWKKYRWNYRKNLAEKLYHPSKIDFTI
jgi:hypothetical protein